MCPPPPTEVLLVGGGVVGLSIAYELASAGRSVRVVERGEPGREASWAGAGILPPGSWFSDEPAVEALAAVSHPLHKEWSRRLFEASGVDDELESCGALYALPEGSAAHRRDEGQPLHDKFRGWRQRGIESQRITADSCHAVDQELTAGDGYFVPEEMQVRNPRRLEALRIACERLGVVIESNAAIVGFRCDGDQILAAQTDRQEFVAGEYCLAAGAWTGRLAKQLGVEAPTKPIRGQMLLLRTPQRRLRRILHDDGRYLVPRRDGRVLVGATVEDAGFDKSTSAADLDGLLRFAHAAAPCLRGAPVEASWAGLRPASGDGLPIIGRLPRRRNGWVAGGHYRSGLQFAPATAVAVRQMMAGESTTIDLSAFSPARFQTLAAT